MVDKKSKVEVTDAPDFGAEDAPPAWVSEQTRAEQELGRKVAQENALKYAAAEARRVEEEAQIKTDADEKEAATRAAQRMPRNYSANQQVKP